MDIKPLKELQAVDERTLLFTPLGLGRMRPEDSADFQQRVALTLRLADEVAETTRRKFEQLRTAFIQGALCYELFTLVEDAAHLTLEQALRDRFAAHHHGRTVEIQDGAGQVHQIRMISYSEFFDRLAAIRRPRIRRGDTGEWRQFNGMLSALLAWARGEGLLRGQRNRSREPAQRALRNIVAHGAYHLTSPPSAARALSDLAETINHLWGHPTPGGRLYPAPVERDIIAIGWTDNGDRTCAGYAAQLASPDAADRFTYVLVRAVFDDPNLMEFDARTATTAFPALYLWGPGTREECAAWLGVHRPTADRCDYLDQIVLLRSHRGRVDLPLYPAVAAGLHGADRAGTWYAVQADRALDALGHVRAVADAVQGHAQSGDCRVCPVRTLACGSLATVVQAASHAGADTAPVQVPDVRTPLAERFG